MDDLFSAFSDDVRHVVRCTAKMAVVSQNEQLKDSGDSVNLSLMYTYIGIVHWTVWCDYYWKMTMIFYFNEEHSACSNAAFNKWKSKNYVGIR